MSMKGQGKGGGEGAGAGKSRSMFMDFYAQSAREDMRRGGGAKKAAKHVHGFLPPGGAGAHAAVGDDEGAVCGRGGQEPHQRQLEPLRAVSGGAHGGRGAAGADDRGAADAHDVLADRGRGG